MKLLNHHNLPMKQLMSLKNSNTLLDLIQLRTPREVMLASSLRSHSITHMLNSLDLSSSESTKISFSIQTAVLSAAIVNNLKNTLLPLGSSLLILTHSMLKSTTFKNQVKTQPLVITLKNTTIESWFKENWTRKKRKKMKNLWLNW